VAVGAAVRPRHSADLEIRVARSAEDRAAHHRVRHTVFVEEQALFA